SIFGRTRAPLSRAGSSIFSVISMMSPPVRTAPAGTAVTPDETDKHRCADEHRGPARDPVAPVRPPRHRLAQRADQPFDALARSLDGRLRPRHLGERLRPPLFGVGPFYVHPGVSGFELVLVGRGHD